MSYRTKIRAGSKVRKASFESLDAALEYLEAELRPVAAGTDRGPAQAFMREVAPADQVVARGELRGRGVRAGVDVRGDGSTLAFTGALSRQPLTAAGREDAFQVLRRELLG